MFENIKKYKIILASNSPRRKELLEKLGLEFQVKTLPGIDESYPKDIDPEQIPMFIARKKASAYKLLMADDELLITADTIVYSQGTVFGKPKDRDDAVAMLKKLSSNTHQVMTGVCILTKELIKSFVSVTNVTFDTLSDEEINYYVTTYRPYDKAGAYGIQEWIGLVGVKSIEGSYFNVMGLPIQKLYNELKKILK